MSPADLTALTRRLAPTHAQLNATELSRVLGFKSPWVMAGLKVAARRSCASWLWRLVRRLGCLAGLCGGVCRDGAWGCTTCGKTLNYHDN